LGAVEMLEEAVDIALRIDQDGTAVELDQVGGVAEALGAERVDLDHACIPRACMPPAMFAALSKPDIARKAAAWRLRPPDRHTTRVGRAGSSDSREDGRSARRILTAPGNVPSSHSNGSLTSRTTASFSFTQCSHSWAGIWLISTPLRYPKPPLDGRRCADRRRLHFAAVEPADRPRRTRVRICYEPAGPVRSPRLRQSRILPLQPRHAS